MKLRWSYSPLIVLRTVFTMLWDESMTQWIARFTHEWLMIFMDWLTKNLANPHCINFNSLSFIANGLILWMFDIIAKYCVSTHPIRPQTKTTWFDWSNSTSIYVKNDSKRSLRIKVNIYFRRCVRCSLKVSSRAQSSIYTLYVNVWWQMKCN